MVAHVCNPSYLGGRGKKITNSRPIWAKVGRSYLINKIQNKILGRGQEVIPMVEYLPSKHKILG
jgi:hypothetical protein